MPAAPHSSASIRVLLDARYAREKPSGIGVYVQSLVDRLPGYAPMDEFVFWAHPAAARPLSHASNSSDVVKRAGPNSPWAVLWPQRDASLVDADVFHNPHNLLPRGIPCPSVVTVHDVMALEEPGMHLRGIERVAKRFYYQQAIWRALRDATRLIAPSEATADRICQLVPNAARRLHVILEAADASFRAPNDSNAASLRAAELSGTDAPYLLVVGANTPSKRHDLALAAFAAAVPKPWRMVFVQRRKARAGLAALARQLHVADRVTWLNAIPREDLVTLMQTAGALVQPSLYEGFGLPVLEAMACACPVVASDIAPFREIARGTALLFPPGDQAKLEDALRQITRSSELRRSLSEQGAARAKEFSWDRCARETLAVYHAAANARR